MKGSALPASFCVRALRQSAVCHNECARGAREIALFYAMVPWCSGLAYVPVKDEIAGSNPVGTASFLVCPSATVTATSSSKAGLCSPT